MLKNANEIQEKLTDEQYVPIRGHTVYYGNGFCILYKTKNQFLYEGFYERLDLSMCVSCNN